MKSVHFIKLASGVLIVLASIQADAQSSGVAATASTSSPASSATTMKTPSASATTQAADQQLAKAVRSAMKQAKHKGLKSAYIRVRASNGVVTLSGVVADAGQIALAINVAKGVAGVTSVIAKLEIRTDIGERGGQ